MRGLSASKGAEQLGDEDAYYRFGDGSRKLAEEIYARNAGHTLSLTGYGEHGKTSFTVYEGDVNEWLLHQPAMYYCVGQMTPIEPGQPT